MKNQSRRAFLRGAGQISIGLPLACFAADWGNGSKIFAQETTAATQKLLTFYFPNGCEQGFWNYEQALSPLKDIQSKIIVLSDITNPVSEANRIDPHLQGGAALFVGARLANEQQGTMISMDQYLSQKIDQNTLLKKPLVTGVLRGWEGNIYRVGGWLYRSWLADGTSVQPILQPLTIFRMLMTDKNLPLEEKAAAFNLKRSVLDSVVQQMKSLNGDASRLPPSHKLLLNAHLEHIRALEKDIIRLQTETIAQCQTSVAEPGTFALGSDGRLQYKDFETIFQLQTDLMVLALQCGATNTGSLMYGAAAEDYVTDKVSLSIPCHRSSHYNNNEERDVFINYRRFYMERLRYLMTKLEAAKILDTTTIVVGSEFGDGRSHSINQIPHLIAGGGGNLKMGQVLSEPDHTLADIYRTVLTGIGHPVNSFGESIFNKGLVTRMLK